MRLHEIFKPSNRSKKIAAQLKLCESVILAEDASSDDIKDKILYLRSLLNDPGLDNKSKKEAQRMYLMLKSKLEKNMAMKKVAPKPKSQPVDDRPNVGHYDLSDLEEASNKIVESLEPGRPGTSPKKKN